MTHGAERSRRRRRPAAQQHAAVPDLQLLHRPAGRLPPAGLSGARRRIELRPVDPGDDEFLFRVYASTREEELARGAVDARRRRRSCAQQFEAQHAYYHEHYAGASFDVVLVDGEPAGRLYVDRWRDEIRIVDIALLPEHRGRGIGTALLRELLAEADAAGKPVTIHVEKFNPARRLYERLGFVENGRARGV